MKKISKKEAELISKTYKLGKLKNIKIINEGLSNYNFVLKTEKGEFIIRFIGCDFNEEKQEGMKILFKLLNYLEKNKFFYDVPKPIKNLKNKNLSKLNGKYFWVYKKIKGKSVKKLNNIKLKSMVRALAKYHQGVKNFPKIQKVSNFKWLLSNYSKMKRKKPKNKIDKLMLENIGFFEKLLKKILNIKFNENILINHCDFHKDNLLFEGNKVIAILDLDNLHYYPRINDLSVVVRHNCFSKRKLNEKKMNHVLKEYEKISKLSKREKKMLINYMILNNCIVFWWISQEMKKGLDKRESLIRQVITKTKDLEKFLK